MARKVKTSARQRDLQRWNDLKAERGSSWDPHYRELADLMMPRRFRGQASEVNKGKKKNEKILNTVAGISIRTLAAGMMAGIMSPSRPWMRMAVQLPADLLYLRENEEVKGWEHDATEVLLSLLARTNVYKATSGSVFPDLAWAGTSASVLLKDRNTVVRQYPLQVGTYVLACSCDGTVDTLLREVAYTVAGAVEEFGEDQVSAHVRKLYDDGKLDVRVPVLHIVEPNRDFNPRSSLSTRKRWSSRWMELGNAADGRVGYLRESGFDSFRALTPRWSTDGEDTYGRSPGMDALPATRQVQKLEYRLALTLALLTTPPTTAPTELENNGGVDLSPGGTQYIDQGTGQRKVEPIVDLAALSAAIDKIEAAILRREKAIREAFFVDFWLAMLGNDRATPDTAEEVRAKKEERMLQLGPVLESIQTEYLEPLVELTFADAMEAGMIPPPPKVLTDALTARGHGAISLDVEYVSIAATAQKALGLTNVRAFLELVAQGGNIDSQAVDLVDVDTLINEAARLLGINPKIVKAMEVVKQLRAARAKQQQAAETGQAMMGAAGAAKDLGTTPAPGPDNLLGSTLAALGPQAAQLLPMDRRLMA